MDNETILNETELNEAEATVEKAANGIREDFAERYQSAQKACKTTLERLTRDLRESNGNPYIRSTSTFRYDIYRTATPTPSTPSCSSRPTAARSARCCWRPRCSPRRTLPSSRISESDLQTGGKISLQKGVFPPFYFI